MTSNSSSKCTGQHVSNGTNDRSAMTTTSSTPRNSPKSQTPSSPKSQQPQQQQYPRWFNFLIAIMAFQCGFIVLVELNDHSSSDWSHAAMDVLVHHDSANNNNGCGDAHNHHQRDMAVNHNNAVLAALLRSSRSCSKRRRRRSLRGGDQQLTQQGIPRILAIYFPQYHRDPLNDKNWGANFTDWVSLQNAPPNNRMGYPIPRPLPSSDDSSANAAGNGGLGYYNLNDKITRQKQGQLARAHGIDGFIYHHYWFYDPTGPNLAEPLLRMLDDGQPDLPFFFNWCAVRWVNVWMGRAIFQTIPTNKNRAIVLQEQYWNVTAAQIKAHYDWLRPFFHHPNYISIDNQPVFMMYNYDQRAIPIIDQMRSYARQDGFDGLYWIQGRSAMPSHIYEPPTDLKDNLKRQLMRTMQTLEMIGFHNQSTIVNQTMAYPFPLNYVTKPYTVPKWCLEPGSSSYRNNNNDNNVTGRPEILGVVTAFDNTPRRPGAEASIYNQGTPKMTLERFRRNVFAALYYQMCCVVSGGEKQDGRSTTAQGDNQKTTNSTTNNNNNDDRFIAINSWNEWAEGMAMEPSDVFGNGYLQVIRDVKAHVARLNCDADQVPTASRGTNDRTSRMTTDEIRAEYVKSMNWVHPSVKRAQRRKEQRGG